MCLPFIAEVDEREKREPSEHTDDDAQHDGENETQRVRRMRVHCRLLVRAAQSTCATH